MPLLDLEDADIRLEAMTLKDLQHVPDSFGVSGVSSLPKVTGPVYLNVVEGTYHSDAESSALLRDIGGSLALHEITRIFYNKMFQDSHLNKFVLNQEDPHAQRLGDWIVEKMGGEGLPWTLERSTRPRCPIRLADGRDHVVHDRTSAHVAAWFSTKRPASEAGRRFKLPDARAWMRLMFWSAIEAGAFQRSPAFESWFIQFIGHFIRIYESSAVRYAKESCQWSASATSNLEAYHGSGNIMVDLLTPNEVITYLAACASAATDYAKQA